jgi:hypothetical protein
MARCKQVSQAAATYIPRNLIGPPVRQRLMVTYSDSSAEASPEPERKSP